MTNARPANCSRNHRLQLGGKLQRRSQDHTVLRDILGMRIVARTSCGPPLRHSYAYDDRTRKYAHADLALRTHTGRRLLPVLAADAGPAGATYVF